MKNAFNSVLVIGFIALGLTWAHAQPQAALKTPGQQVPAAAKPPIKPVPQAIVLKPPLQGLISMGNISFHRHDDTKPDNSLQYIYAKPGILDGVVLNFTWAQLQPQRNEDVATAPIDKALAKIRAYNKQYPSKPLSVRLRIYAGPNAPLWVKNIGGIPIKIQYRGEELSIPRFWTPAYSKAWRKLQEQLAQKYDAEPLIREVAMTSCSSVTSEPFVFAGGALSLKQMQKAGFSDGVYRRCLTQAPKDYIDWQSTRVEYPFSPFRVSDFGNPHPENKVTSAIMRHWRKEMGLSGVLSNHTFQSPTPAQLNAIYETMKKIGPPIEVQANAPTGMDYDATIHYAVSLGASAVEIWPETFDRIPEKKLQTWSAKIKGNKSP